MNGELVAIPILPNGQGDPGRNSVIVTNFGFTRASGLPPIPLASIANNGDAVVFQVYDSTGVPDLCDVYLLKNLDAILAAPKIPSTDISQAAPTSLSDSNVVDIRASDSTNVAADPSLSQDGSLVFYGEDYNNTFNFENFFPSVATGNWDIGLARRDGTGDVRFMVAGNQSGLKPFPTGNRLTYTRAIANPNDWHVFATTLIVESDVGAATVPLPEVGTNSTTVGGNPVTVPFILTDSAVAITTAAGVVDATGTTVELPVDQVINFPTGTATPEITVFTPVFPVTNIQLPDPAITIPVIRNFGPSGTQFFPPVTITIAYTEAEVGQLADENTIIPYLFNAGTQQYEPIAAQFLSSVVVDTVNNTVSFQTDHFSIYGIGGPKAVVAPQRPWTWGILVAALMLAAGTMLTARRRVARLPETE